LAVQLGRVPPAEGGMSAGRRAELVRRLEEIRAEEPPDGCKVMEYLRWLGRRSEVECDIRKLDEE